MEKELKKVKDYYREAYFDEETEKRIRERVFQNRGNPALTKQGKGLAKKIAYFTAAFVVLFGLFIGSAFVSPTMAEVASKIPYLNKVFKSEPILEEIHHTLKDKGYLVMGVGYSVDDKVYHVTVKGTDDEYLNKVKDEVKKITTGIIKARGYDAFNVEVGKERTVENVEKGPREKAASKLMDAMLPIGEKLREQNFKIGPYGVGYANPTTKKLTISIDIPDTEKRTDELKKIIQNGLKTANINNYEIELRPYNLKKRETEMKWSKILSVIWEGLGGKKEYKVIGYGYSYKNDVMNIFIKTSVDKTDEDASELANKIELAINEFLKSDDLKGLVGDQAYKIVVRDKNYQDIK